MANSCLCPICFTLYPAEKLRSEWPTCPDCESEAITVELESTDTFLAKHSLEELESMLAAWLEQEGFYEAYKQAKAERMRAVIEMKRSTA